MLGVTCCLLGSGSLCWSVGEAMLRPVASGPGVCTALDSTTVCVLVYARPVLGPGEADMNAAGCAQAPAVTGARAVSAEKKVSTCE